MMLQLLIATLARHLWPAAQPSQLPKKPLPMPYDLNGRYFVTMMADDAATPAMGDMLLDLSKVFGVPVQADLFSSAGFFPLCERVSL